MADEDLDSEARRKFVKGAAATGVAATGLTAFSGSAAAQQDIRDLEVGAINLQGGVLNVNVQNVDVLRNLDIDDIIVTVIGGDVVVNVENVDILRFEDEVNIIRDVNIEDVVDIQDNVVQVAILALSDAGDIVAQGSGATNDL